MKKAKINRDEPAHDAISRPLRILVAPLDWGLGHATRCIPVIYELLAQQAEVWLAGEGAQEALLKQEFPALPFLPLEGYRVKYSRSPGLLKTLTVQVPRLLRRIKAEQEWVKKTADSCGFDAILSDNRFGLYHPTIPCVFITHQLLIKTPLGSIAERWLQGANYRHINRFTECWVPDEEGISNLGGGLSHPSRKPAVPLHYTGILSRLHKTDIPEEKGHLFISLSGPEPQRTLLENRVVEDISHYNGTAVVVRGLPGTAAVIPSTNDIRFYNHLSTADYNREMERAEFVISRSGYSTVMDLVTLGKKSILVPTPGQTEQEYLSQSLQQQIAYSIGQKDFSLSQALQAARSFEYNMPNLTPASTLSKVISAFLEKLKYQAPDLG